MCRFLKTAVFLLASCATAFAQSGSSVRQSGFVTPGHNAKWTTNGIIQDGGAGAGNGTVIGPATSTPGDFVIWSDTVGSVLADYPPSTAIDSICSTNNNTLIRLSGTWQCAAYSAQFTVGNTLSIASVAWSLITSTPTTLAGYGITNARPVLTSGTTLFLSGAGVDTGACTSLAPCATFQYAINYAQNNYDLANHNVTISPALNTTYAGFSVSGNFVGGICNLFIQGSPQQAITAATNATPIVVTYTGNNPTNGDNVIIAGVVGNTAANGSWKVASVNTGAKTFQLANSAGNGGYVSGGTFYDQSALVISGGNSAAAITATQYGCINILGGIEVTSSGLQDVISSIYSSVKFLNGVQLAAPCSVCGMLYGTRQGYLEINGGMAVSANAFEILEADHYGAVRWNGGILGFTANVTITNALFEADSGEIVETGGGSIATNTYTVSSGFGALQLDAGNVQIEGFNPPQTTFFGSVSLTTPYSWTPNATSGTNPGATLTTNGFTLYGPAVAGTVFASCPATPVAGQYCYVTDGKASNCGDSACTTWGTNVTGGTGALQLLVWYNGTHWTLVGK